MQPKASPAGDLRTLARAAGDTSAAGDISAAGDSPVTAAASPAALLPPPRFPWKTRVLLPGAIMVALALLLGYSAQDVLFPPLGVKVVPVVVKSVDGGGSAGAAPTTTPARSGDSEPTPSPTQSPTPSPAPSMASGATVQAPGWVEADPYSIAVTALAGGVVEEVLALEGQSVKAGEVVARLVDADAKLALARADAELAEKRATLEAAQRQWDNPVERTRAVATNEAMVAQTKAHIEKHHAEVAVEKAKLAQAREEFERVEASAASRAVSELEVIRARQALAAQEATVTATEAELAIFNADLAQRTAELTAARDNLRLRIEESKALAEAKAAVALAEAARDEAALRLSRMAVRSPVDGIVMQRLVEPGSKLLLDMDDPRSAQAVRLYDPKKLQVRVDVPLADAAKVGVGMRAQIVVGVLPDRTFSGMVTRIVHEADIQKNTLQVKVAITDPSPALKPEMLARVRFTAGGAVASEGGEAGGATARARSGSGGGAGAGAGGGLTIFAPLALIHRHAGGDATAWVFDPRRGAAVHKSIALGGFQQGGWVAVASGLAPGDQLIVAGADELTDGQRVRVIGEADPATLSTNHEGSDHGAH